MLFFDVRGRCTWLFRKSGQETAKRRLRERQRVCRRLCRGLLGLTKKPSDKHGEKEMLSSGSERGKRGEEYRAKSR